MLREAFVFWPPKPAALPFSCKQILFKKVCLIFLPRPNQVESDRKSILQLWELRQHIDCLIHIATKSAAFVNNKNVGKTPFQASKYLLGGLCLDFRSLLSLFIVHPFLPSLPWFFLSLFILQAFPLWSPALVVRTPTCLPKTSPNRQLACPKAGPDKPKTCQRRAPDHAPSAQQAYAGVAKLFKKCRFSWNKKNSWFL